MSRKFSKLCTSENELIPGLPNDIALECLLRVPITSHPTLRSVSHNWKATVSHPHFFSLRRRGGVAEHLVFLIQPLANVRPVSRQILKIDEDSEENIPPLCPLLYNLSVYNVTKQEWGNLGDITIPMFAQCIALPNVGKVIVLGGWDPATLDPVSRVLVIDLVNGTWKEGSPMNTARSFFACAAVGPSSVFVAGGHDGRKNALKTAEVYDAEADQWSALPDMMEERDECHGLVLSDDSKFWVVSGYGTESQGRFRSDAEIYDPETKTWSHHDGVWPYPGHTPKSTAVVGQQRQWISFIAREMREFDFEELSWKTLNMGPIPKTVSESSSISIVDMGDNERMMVMGNGEKCSKECNEGCGGEGVLMVQRTKEVDKNKYGSNWCWSHVHTPSRYLGFPFCTSHLFI